MPALRIYLVRDDVDPRLIRISTLIKINALVNISALTIIRLLSFLFSLILLSFALLLLSLAHFLFTDGFQHRILGCILHPFGAISLEDINLRLFGIAKLFLKRGVVVFWQGIEDPDAFVILVLGICVQGRDYCLATGVPVCWALFCFRIFW